MNDGLFVLWLTKRLNKPVREVKNMPSTLLEQWRAYYIVTPFGDDE